MDQAEPRRLRVVYGDEPDTRTCTQCGQIRTWAMFVTASSGTPSTVCAICRKGAPLPADDVSRDAARSRRRFAVRAVTESMPRFRKSDLSMLDTGKGDPEIEALRAQRPVTRGDCEGGERPCPWVSCRYHLFLDVDPKTGSIKYNRPDLEPHELTQSCLLDVADAGGVTLEEAGGLINVTRERIRQIAGKAFSLLAKKAPDLAEAALDEPQERESQLASIMSPNGGAGTSDDDDDRTADGDWKPRPKNLFADEGTDEGDAAFVGALYDRALRDRCALESGERRVWNGHYLSPRHGAVLDVLPGFFEAHGRGPTFRELAQLLDPDGAAGHSSVVAVRSRCLTLREIGAVEWSRGSGVVMRRVVSEVVDGSVSQGGPESSTASEKQEEKAMRKRGEVRDGMITALREGPHTRAELAQKLGISDAHVGATLTRLRLAGEAVRCDDGKWTAGAGAGSTKPKAGAPKRSAGAPATRPKPARKPSPSGDPIVVQLRERLEQIDQQRAPIVAALRAFGEEVA